MQRQHRGRFLIWKGSGGQNFKLQHALGGGDLGHHLLQRLVHLAGLGGDGDTGAAVGGNGLVDGQYICPGIGKNRQYVGQYTRRILQESIEGDDAPGLHVLEAVRM